MPTGPPGPAAPSRPRAEGCNSLQSMPPVRSAAGLPREKSKQQAPAQRLILNHELRPHGRSGPQPPHRGGPLLASAGRFERLSAGCCPKSPADRRCRNRLRNHSATDPAASALTAALPATPQPAPQPRSNRHRALPFPLKTIRPAFKRVHLVGLAPSLSSDARNRTGRPYILRYSTNGSRREAPPPGHCRSCKWS